MTFRFRTVSLPHDTQLLHSWIATEHAAFWGMRHATAAQVESAYAQLLDTPRYQVLLGLEHQDPRFLVELYDPLESPLAGAYRHIPGDLGLHFLAPAATAPEAGFTYRALAAAVQQGFDDPRVQRIIVEPDLRNKSIHALNARVGFRPVGPVRLTEADGGTKHALLSIITRAEFEQATGAVLTGTVLSPERWERANRHVLAKALGEFSHERLLEPAEHGEQSYSLHKDGHRYRFTAGRYRMNHWLVQPSSIIHERFADGS